MSKVIAVFSKGWCENHYKRKPKCLHSGEGQKVLVVDIDPRVYTSGLGIDKNRKTIYDVLIGEERQRMLLSKQQLENLINNPFQRTAGRGRNRAYRV